MTENLQNKILYTTVQKSQLPANIKEFVCDFVIQQNIQTSHSKKWLQFKHKENKQPPFRIYFSTFKKPSTLMHVYKLENDKFHLKGKIQRIGEPRVQRKKKQVTYQQINSDQSEEFTEKRLTLGYESSQDDSQYDSDGSQSSSVGMAPVSEQSKARVKSALIQILNRYQRVSSIKQLNQLLKKQYKIKIPESSAKQIAQKICTSQRKSKGYSLKPEYIDQDQRMQAKKKVKTD